MAPSGAARDAWVGYGDIGPDTRWRDALAGVDTIVHLAGLAHLPDGHTAAAAQSFQRTNADGTAGFAQGGSGGRRAPFRADERPALVHGHSSAHPITEAAEPRPNTAYARSKLEAEKRLQTWHAAHNCNRVILRPPMIYGTHARGNFRRLVSLVRSGLPIPLGAATAPKSFVGVDNVADAVCAVSSTRPPPTAYSSSPTRKPPTAHFIRRIAAALGERVLVPRMPMAILRHGCGWPAAKRTTCVCSSRSRSMRAAREAVGWSPPVSG